MHYRVRISGEVVAAVGPQATRRVPVPKAEDSPVLFEFTRAWRELDALPGPIREDLRLEIEARSKPTGSKTNPSWQPVERNPPKPEAPASSSESANEPLKEPQIFEALRDALDGASYAQLQQVAKAIGLKAQGTKDELREAAASVLFVNGQLAEGDAAQEALRLLDTATTS